MFQAMGFDETFDVDIEKLSQLYKDLQKRLHPDKYSQKSEVTISALKHGCQSQGKISGKMKLFRGRGKVREFCGWSGKFRKDLESQAI